MTTVAPAVRRPAPAIAPLALQEGVRLLRHPVTVLGFGLLAFGLAFESATESGPRQAFTTIDVSVVFFPGVLMILAAYLVATRDLRAGSDDLLAPTPTPRATRVLALCAGSLAPVALAAAAVLAVHAVQQGHDEYVVLPSPAHLAQGPAAVWGACVLGVLVAVWLPSRGAVALVVVLVVAVNLWLAGDGAGQRQLFSPAMTWPVWVGDGTEWGGVQPGDPDLHLLYVLGLGALAVAGAWLRTAADRTAPVLVGVVALAVTVVAGVGQLP